MQAFLPTVVGSLQGGPRDLQLLEFMLLSNPPLLNMGWTNRLASTDWKRAEVMGLTSTISL